jgi:hypothetical protein
MNIRRIAVFLIAMLAAVACEKAAEDRQDAEQVVTGDILTCMDDYHRVLRPLMHQALPDKNVAAFKENSAQLQECAEKLAVAAIPEKYEEHKTEITALAREVLDTTKIFANDCQTGDDEKIFASFLVAHDKYEALADIVYKL